LPRDFEEYTSSLVHRIYSQSLSSDCGTPNSHIFVNFENFWKRLNSCKERIWIHRKKKIRKISAPRPTPIHKLSVASMVWNISIGQLGLSGHAPSQLLYTCSLAEYEKLGRSPWCHSKN